MSDLEDRFRVPYDNVALAWRCPRCNMWLGMEGFLLWSPHHGIYCEECEECEELRDDEVRSDAP